MNEWIVILLIVLGVFVFFTPVLFSEFFNGRAMPKPPAPDPKPAPPPAPLPRKRVAVLRADYEKIVNENERLRAIYVDHAMEMGEKIAILTEENAAQARRITELEHAESLNVSA